MPEQSTLAFEQAFSALRRFTNRRAASQPVDHCELCSLGLAYDHPHLVELKSRHIVCACEACALLFDGTEKLPYKRISRDPQLLSHFEMTDAQWESLLIPINMAFLFESSVDNRMIALYPSPAGAVESLLPLDSWQEIAAQNPVLQRLRPDIEALLINRVGEARGMGSAEFYIAPIDECYKLVGIIRGNWKGLSGGSEVWIEIARFFSELRGKSEIIGGGSNA